MKNHKYSFYFLLIIFIEFVVANFNNNIIETSLSAKVLKHDITLSESEYQTINRALEYYKKIINNKFDKKSEADNFISLENDELFSDVFTDKETFLKLRKKHLLNKENLETFTSLIYKALSDYDGKEMETMSFEYDGYEFKFPFSSKR